MSAKLLRRVAAMPVFSARSAQMAAAGLPSTASHDRFSRDSGLKAMREG